jgi:hypothetical protein
LTATRIGTSAAFAWSTAVVGGHHDHRDVGGLGAAGAHGGERLVARRVEERDRLAVVLVDLVGADVLGDAAGLARRHVRLADGVEQRRLAVVDVAHDRDHRRARLEVLVGVLEVRLGLGVLGRRDDLDLLVELVGQQLDGVVGQGLRERGHLAQAHQLLDDLGDGDAQVLGDVLDGRARVDPDDVRLQRRLVLRDGLLVGAAPPPAAAPPRRALRRAAAGAATGAAARAAALAPGGLRVDDHAAHAAGRAGRALALQRGARGPLALAAAGLTAGRALAVARRLAAAAAVALLAGAGLAAFARRLRQVLRTRGARGAVAEAGPLLDDGLRRLLGAVAALLGLRLAGQRGVGQLLVHGGRGRLDLDAIGSKALDDLRHRHVVLLG